MTELTDFKRKLEQDLKIARWSPTDSELREIARRISSAKPQTADTPHTAVVEVCPGTLFRVEEGIDNSDIRALLALATNVAKKG